MTVAFDPSNWRDLPEMCLDDLWLIESRAAHAPTLDYVPLKGGFVPAIPYWLMLRYTRPGWTVYDPMSGAMVTRRVGDKIARDVISVDLTDRGLEDDPLYDELILADARTYNPGPVDLVIWHPPYRSAIRFSDDTADLSTMGFEDFWLSVNACLEMLNRSLKPDRMCAVVIGNVYEDGCIVPLPFFMNNAVRLINPAWRLKGWVTKDFQGNRQGEDNLWRARAAAGDTFRFCHETILIYHKPGK